MRNARTVPSIAAFYALISSMAFAAIPSVDSMLAKKLAAVEELITKGNHAGAIQSALTGFSLNASNCRAIEARSIGSRDEAGQEIVARTSFDQLVVLDPARGAFKNARQLVGVLAHELTHCDQHQHLYSLALAHDRQLAPLKDKVTLLRVLADLEEVAHVAVRESPARSAALTKYKELSAKYGLELSAHATLELVKRVLDDLRLYKRNLEELHEMEAVLRALDVPGAIARPPRGKPASPEFAFQFRYLTVATNRFLWQRRLGGVPVEAFCKLANLVPFPLTLRHERTCGDAVRFVTDHLASVPE